MSKKSKTPAIEKKPDHDLETFNQLPEETKELMRLKDRDEKTSGPEQVVIARKIKETDQAEK